MNTPSKRFSKASYHIQYVPMWSCWMVADVFRLVTTYYDGELGIPREG